jgi:hypothetical protein
MVAEKTGLQARVAWKAWEGEAKGKELGKMTIIGNE